MKKISLLLALTIVVSCSDDASEEPSARDRCASDENSYAVSGELRIPSEEGEELVFPFDNAGSLDVGVIRGSEIVLGVGSLPRSEDAPPILLKFRENVASNDPLDVITNTVVEGPVTVTVADGSGVPNDATRRSDLSLVECGIPDGTICAQVALDTTGEGAISDDDEKVFAATGGEVRLVEVDNVASRLKMDFEIDLGRNVLTTGDTSSGVIRGCLNAEYDRSGGGSGWVLQ